jgi:hypothetical protein
VFILNAASKAACFLFVRHSFFYSPFPSFPAAATNFTRSNLLTLTAAHGEVPAYNIAKILFSQARLWELDGTVF